MPICAIPKGIDFDVESKTFLKLIKICWAVSGLKYAKDWPSSMGPTFVLNIRLKGLGSVRSSDPQEGHLLSDRLSARHLDLQDLQSVNGSVNVSSWPENFKTEGLLKMAASKPSTSSLS